MTRILFLVKPATYLVNGLAYIESVENASV